MPQTEKKSFIMYADYRHNFNLLTGEQVKELLNVMFDYNDGISTQITDPMIVMAFSFIKANMDRDFAKWTNIVERNRANGSKGGRPTKRKRKSLVSNDINPKNPVGNLGTQDNPKNPAEPKKPDNDNDNEKVIVNVLTIHRINKLFKRRDTTEWSDKELSKLKSLVKRKDFETEMAELEVFYNSSYPYKRKDIQTFLNNWTTELDRSRENTQTVQEDY